MFFKFFFHFEKNEKKKKSNFEKYVIYNILVSKNQKKIKNPWSLFQ